VNNLPLSRGGCCTTRRLRKRFATGRDGAAAAAAAARPVGVADPRREGVRSVRASFASGVLRARADQTTRYISSEKD